MRKLLAGILLIISFVLPARASEFVVAINYTNPLKLSLDQQNTTLAEMKASGVHVVRAYVVPEDADKTLDFAKRAMSNGIKLVLNTGLIYYPNAPKRPWPNAYNQFSGYPLSYADPVQYKNYLQALLAKLDAAGIKLAGIEPANEINSTGFNAEFPLPGEGKIFGMNDLYHDPEAQQIAKGYLQYIKILAATKEARDNSTLNRSTPIVSAGLVGYEGPEGPFKNSQLDMVSANATLDFMRANGIDKYVDAYGVHVYPWTNNPGNQAAAKDRWNRLGQYVLKDCYPAGSSNGKPCWLTEWGFKNPDTSCPINENDRNELVQEMRNDFTQYAHAQRLLGIIYYQWSDDDKHYGVYRCNGLTNAGRMALSPL